MRRIPPNTATITATTQKSNSITPSAAAPPAGPIRPAISQAAANIIDTVIRSTGDRGKGDASKEPGPRAAVRDELPLVRRP